MTLGKGKKNSYIPLESSRNQNQGYFTNYPLHVFFILGNEFCERFSYYGMRAVLTLFLWKELGFSKNVSTSLYHAFVLLCYGFAIPGAMIADGWLGKYRTILYLSMFYLLGNILITLSAIPFANNLSWLTFVALTLIAFGTGGIKPCVSSFGGDQFKEEQKRQKESFFSLFYLTINIGSLISTLLIPFLRGEIYCFDSNCYALCFGIPAILMFISIITFFIGTKWYTRVPAGESILSRFMGCIVTALKRKCICGKQEGEKKEHWLDYAAPEYDKNFISDVRDVLKVCVLFIPLPVFWALFDQQGSKWTFQAQQMNGEMGNLVVFPDMISFLNPFLVVLVVPLLESVIYPCFDKLRIPNRPLQRMTFGMILAATAFLVAGFLQIAISSEQPALISSGNSKVQFINVASYDIPVAFSDKDGQHIEITIKSLDVSSYYYLNSSTNHSFHIEWKDGSEEKIFDLEETKAYQLFLTEEKIVKLEVQPDILKTEKGESKARIFNGLSYPTTVLLKTTKDQESEPTKFEDIEPNSVSKTKTLIFADFSVQYLDENNKTTNLSTVIKSKNGAVYSILLIEENNKVIIKQILEIEPWKINIFLQTPQYFIITVAECLFSVTGLAFAYTQAPISMKSILAAAWLLTVCFGNIIIIIVQTAASTISPVIEFFLFSGLMYLVSIIFAIMAYFYVYVTPRVEEEQMSETDKITNGDPRLGEDYSKMGIDNKAMSNFSPSDYSSSNL